jgi:hypothetical protein
MRNGLLLLLVLFVLAAVAASWWWRDDVSSPSAPAPIGEANPANASPTAVTVADAASQVAASTSPERMLAEGVSTAGSNQQPPLPADAKWLTVRVVDAATKAPVPRAEVRWALQTMWQQVQQLPEAERTDLYNDPEAVVRRFGWTTHADDQGLARVAHANAHVRVFAYSDGRYGNHGFDAKQAAPAGGFVVEIEPDRTLAARVVRNDGAPCPGVSVEVRTFGADGKVRPHGWVQPVRSDADGIATFRHVQLWTRGLGRLPPDGLTWRVRLQVPGLDDPGVAIDPASPPAEPVELQMPATGVVVACVRHLGQPLTTQVTFQVWRGAADDNDQSNDARRYPAGEGGEARIEVAAREGELVVRGNLGSADVVTTIQAPRGQGEVVRAELTTDGIFALTGLLVDADSAPLRNATVSTDFDFEIAMGNGSLTTDAQGRFLWLLTRGSQDTATIKKLVFSQATGAAVVRASIAKRDIQRGVTDLGAIQLSAGRLVVAARFVSEAPATRGTWPCEVEALADRRTHDGKEVWERVEALTRSDLPEGRFELRGETRPARHRLRFPTTAHLPIAPIEFAVGTKDLEIPIAAGHALAATVMLDEIVSGDRVRGVLRPKFAPPPEPKSSERAFFHHGRYEVRAYNHEKGACRLQWQGLPAGTYELVITVAATDTPLATIADVVVPQPVPGDDRLSAIDGKGRVRAVSFHVTFAGGSDEARQREGPIAFVQPQSDPKEWNGIQLSADWPIPLPLDVVELLVCAPGFVPQKVVVDRDVTGPVAVTLEPHPRVTLTFPGLPALPEGATLHVSLDGKVAPGASQLRFRTENRGGPLDSLIGAQSGSGQLRDGRISLPIGEGRYRLSAFLCKAGDRSGKPVRGLVPAEIVGGRDLAPIEVTVPADELQKALAPK